MKQSKLFVCVLLALAVGLLAGRVGQGSEPALIDTMDGPGKLLVLVLLGVGLYGALALAAHRVTRYGLSGDAEQVHYIDQATAARWSSDDGAEPVEEQPPTPRGRPARRSKW